MKIAHLLILAALAALAGCGSEGRVRPPPSFVRFLHAAPQFGPLALIREERREAAFEFGGGSTSRFDSGPYNFGLGSSPPGSLPVRIVDFSETLSSDRQYTFVAVAPGGQPQVLVTSVPNFAQGSANARFSVIDAHPDQGAMDVYLVAAGTPLGSVAAQGSISFGPTPATIEVSPQTLRLYLTPAGDPGTVLFESTDIVATAGEDNVYVVHATGGQTTVDFAVSTIRDSTALRIYRQGAGALLRVAQGIDDRLARDVTLDDGTTPLFSTQAFGELSAYVPVSASVQHSLALTPVGAPGTEESSVEFTLQPERYYTALFAGNSTTGITGFVFIEDTRPILQQASFYVASAAGLFGRTLVHILPPGSVINPFFPTTVSTPPSLGSRLALRPGDYELTVQDEETAAILAGPVPLTLAAEGVYGVLQLNAADNVTIDLEYLYDLAP